MGRTKDKVKNMLKRNNMMFSRALYYSTIDIKNGRWLKSAALFWDSIETIVPESRANQPYENNTSRALFNNGILRPHIVNPWMDDVARLENDIREFVSTREGKRLMYKHPYQTSIAQRRDDRGRNIEERLREQYGDLYIHADKLPHYLQEELKDYRNPDGFIRTTAEFLSFYMTLLANSICRQEGLSLLTDRVVANDMSNRILTEKVGKALPKELVDKQLEMVLYKVVLDNIQIDPQTPVDKIVAFKKQYSDELGRFRMEMSQLTNLKGDGESFKAISEQARNIYENGIVPSINDLKRALDESTIKWMVDNYYNYVISGATPIALTAVGLPMTQVLPIGAGLAVGYTVLGSWWTKREMMRNSPYTYLLRVKNNFSKAGRLF